MGFLSTLLDVLVGAAEITAKKVDRMSDEEIENKINRSSSDKTVQDYREFSAKAHDLSARRKNSSNDIVDENKSDYPMENHAYRHTESIAQVKVTDANKDPRLALDDDD